MWTTYSEYLGLTGIVLVVPGAGIEPARPLKPQDFKSCVSTNFTTRALRCEEREIIYYR